MFIGHYACNMLFDHYYKIVYISWISSFFQILQISPLAKVSQHQLILHGDYQRWDVVFLQKCCCKLQPRKCLGLDVANLIISISKNGEKISNFHNFSFFSFSKNQSPSCEIFPQNKIPRIYCCKGCTFLSMCIINWIKCIWILEIKALQWGGEYIYK
jgi:hypothetical protein